jgi:hypothetical protein
MRERHEKIVNIFNVRVNSVVLWHSNYIFGHNKRLPRDEICFELKKIKVQPNLTSHSHPTRDEIKFIIAQQKKDEDFHHLVTRKLTELCWCEIERDEACLLVFPNHRQHHSLCDVSIKRARSCHSSMDHEKKTFNCQFRSFLDLLVWEFE